MLEARVVDQHVETAKGRDRLLDRAVALFAPNQVGLDEMSVTPLGDFAPARFVDVDEAHTHAVGREPLGASPPDAACSAGNERYSVFSLLCHGSPPKTGAGS